MSNIKGEFTDYQNWKESIASAILKSKVESQSTGMVLYTDGGCRPSSRGSAGWGVHGYIYLDTKPSQGHGCVGFTPTKEGYLNLAAGDTGNKDSSLLKEKTVTVLNYIDCLGTIDGISTNNVAELAAVISSLQLVENLGISKLTLKLDSEYAINRCTNFIPYWDIEKTTEVINKDYLLAIKELLDRLKDKVQIDWVWVKGHSDSVGNTAADNLAREAVFLNLNKYSENRITVSNIKGYWKPSPDYNKMLKHTYWCFTTNTEGHLDKENNRTFYHLATPGNNDIAMFGKRVSETVYSVISVKQPDVVLENIRQLLNGFRRDVGATICLADLNVLFKPSVYNKLASDCRHLQRHPYSLNLVDAQKLTLVTELEQPRLAFSAIDALNHLQRVLTSYLNNDLLGFTVTDLTDDIYESVIEKKVVTKKLKADLDDNSSIINCKVLYTDTKGAIKERVLPLCLGLDLPRKNTLAALSSLDPKLILLTYPEEGECDAFRYLCITETNDGSVGIWSAYYSNLSIGRIS